MIQAIIFDCFGVLISDALDVMASELYAKDPVAWGRVSESLERANKGLLTSVESSSRIAAELGLDYETYRRKIAEGEVKDQVLFHYIAELRKTYKTGLLSNIPRGSLDRRFAEGELETYFDAVVASGEIGYAKPEAEAYEITADRLGVRLDACVFVDDRERYCEAARAVGMQAILYQNFAQFKTDLEPLLASS